MEILKGHQIIGELRLWVDLAMMILLVLKGHQIIGELRRLVSYQQLARNIERSPDHWWVTTILHQSVLRVYEIERSPDHWWVTTLSHTTLPKVGLLKGHQIIGELRLVGSFHYKMLTNWKVTRSLVSYDWVSFCLSLSLSIERSPDHWWVTTINELNI